MSEDNIDTITLKLYEYLTTELDCPLDEHDDYDRLHEWLLNSFEPFYTKERNYN